MTDLYRCGDYSALVGYLYDDCEPGERAAIAAHLQGCRACAGELEALGGARQQLAAWTPPDTVLGFRIAPANGESSGVIPFAAGGRVRTGWWRQPLPAWAQLAAAVVIFASGLAVGAARGGAAPAPAESASPEVKAALTVLERRLAGVEQIAQVARTRPERVAGLDVVTNEDTILQRVRHEIASSEERMRREGQKELAIRILQMADTQQRQVDQIENKFVIVRNEFGSALGQLVALQR